MRSTIAQGDKLRGDGRIDEALAEYRTAQSLAEHAVGGGNILTAGYSINIANVLRLEGRFRESLAESERARSVLEAALGPDTVDVAQDLNGVGATYLALGEVAEARAALERDLAICAKKLPPDHPTLASALLGVARVALAEGRTADALAAVDRALPIAEKKPGRGSSFLVDTLVLDGHALTEAGRFDDAGKAFERALDLVTPGGAAATPASAANAQLGPILAARARLELAAGRLAAAAEDAARASAVVQSVTPKDGLVGAALTTCAVALLGLDRRAEAAEAAGHAVAILDGREGDPIDLARARFALARALAPAERERARDLARQARAAFAAAGSRSAKDLAEVDTWLR